MAIQTLNTLETALVSGAAFGFGWNNGGPTGAGSYGPFSGSGFANPTDGGSRTVAYDGVFGSGSNTAGMTPTGPVFGFGFTPAF